MTSFFEGCEKRLEVSFYGSEGRGLLNLSDEVLRGMLAAAKFHIMKDAEVLKNDSVHSYLLSESSMFVFPEKVVVKTCGVTTLLSFIEPLLEEAASKLNLICKGVVYSRGTFIKPELQAAEHSSFSEEEKVLNKYFAKLGKEKSLVLGDIKSGQQWHYYCAGDISTDITLEVSMRGLNREKADVFVFGKYTNGEDMTLASGIHLIHPDSNISSVSFKPYGYSMNSLDGSKFSTIHVTPEYDFSFASFECCGFPLDAADVKEILMKVLVCFNPKSFTIPIHGMIDSAFFAKVETMKIEEFNKTSSSSSLTSENVGSIIFSTFLKVESD